MTPADEWADLEALAKAAEALCATVDATGLLSWLTERDLREFEPEDRAFIVAANPSTILKLIEAARHQPTTPGGES